MTSRLLLQQPARALALVLALTAASTGCGGRPTPIAPPRPSTDAQRAVATLEARRGGGLDELIARASTATGADRARTVRAIGRVGGPAARAALRALVVEADGATATAAAAALGLAAIEEADEAERATVAAALARAAGRPDVDAAVVLEAMGRAGDASVLPMLAAALAQAPAQAEAAAVALGRFGRRSLPLDDGSRAALLTASEHADAGVRYAATWALGREFVPPPVAPGPDPTQAGTTAAPIGAAPPPPPPPPVRALRARLADPEAETRAVAVAGLVRRKSTGVVDAGTWSRLGADPDWRVAVEVARALAADPRHAGPLADLTLAAWKRGATAPGWIHVVLEGLRGLSPGADVDPRVAATVTALRTQTRATWPRGLAAGWIDCLAIAAHGRGAGADWDGGAAQLGCGDEQVPYPARAALVGDEVARRLAPVARRRDAATALLASADPAVRAVGLTALGSTWPDLADEERRALAPAFTRGLASEAAVEAGTAVEAIEPLLADAALPAWAREPLTQGLIDRAASLLAAEVTAPDPELASAIVGVLAGAGARGRPTCARAAAAANPAVAAAGAACLATLDGVELTAPGMRAPTVSAPPAIELGLALDGPARWRVETSAGEVVIVLDADAAPWHVAAIIDLTRRGFYDGLPFHRVVPNFVVQGGDPTGTGWGGPGFTLPAEPGSRLDGDDYRRGAIGIADAGKDTGGSQWFVMHARAPHLEGRYTRIGRVVQGDEVIDRLLIGDRIIKATIEPAR